MIISWDYKSGILSTGEGYRASYIQIFQLLGQYIYATIQFIGLPIYKGIQQTFTECIPFAEGFTEIFKILYSPLKAITVA